MREYEIKTIKFRIENSYQKYAGDDYDKAIEDIAEEFAKDFKKELFEILKNEIPNRVKIKEIDNSSIMFKDSKFVLNKDVVVGLEIGQSVYEMVEKGVVMVKDGNLGKGEG